VRGSDWLLVVDDDEDDEPWLKEYLKKLANKGATLDNVLDSLTKPKLASTSTSSTTVARDADNDSDDDALDALYTKASSSSSSSRVMSLLDYQRIAADLMKDGETVAKALKRLSGRDGTSIIGKQSRAKTLHTSSIANKEAFDKLTEAVDHCLQLGYGDIYVVNRAALLAAIAKAERMCNEQHATSELIEIRRSVLERNGLTFESCACRTANQCNGSWQRR
jgi:hypothetical protein